MQTWNESDQVPVHMFHYWPQCNTPDSKVYGAKWIPPGAHRTQVGPMLAPWTLLSKIVVAEEWLTRIHHRPNLHEIHSLSLHVSKMKTHYWSSDLHRMLSSYNHCINITLQHPFVTIPMLYTKHQNDVFHNLSFPMHLTVCVLVKPYHIIDLAVHWSR